MSVLSERQLHAIIDGMEARLANLEKFLPKFAVGDRVVRKDGRPSVVKEAWTWMYTLEGGDSRAEKDLTMQAGPPAPLADRLRQVIKEHEGVNIDPADLEALLANGDA